MDEPKPKPRQQTLTQRLAMIGGIVLGVIGAMVIAPSLFPRAPGDGFSMSQVACAGVCGAMGAVIGGLVGRLIEGPPKT